jgi:hypothetical protein
MFSSTRRPLTRGTIVKYQVDRSDWFRRVFGANSPMEEAGFVAGRFYVVVSSNMIPMLIDGEEVQTNMITVANLDGWTGLQETLLTQPNMVGVGFGSFPIHCFGSAVGSPGITGSIRSASAFITRMQPRIANPMQLSDFAIPPHRGFFSRGALGGFPILDWDLAETVQPRTAAQIDEDFQRALGEIRRATPNIRAPRVPEVPAFEDANFKYGEHYS